MSENVSTKGLLSWREHIIISKQNIKLRQKLKNWRTKKQFKSNGSAQTKGNQTHRIIQLNQKLSPKWNRQMQKSTKFLICQLIEWISLNDLIWIGNA